MIFFVQGGAREAALRAGVLRLDFEPGADTDARKLLQHVSVAGGRRDFDHRSVDGFPISERIGFRIESFPNDCVFGGDDFRLAPLRKRRELVLVLNLVRGVQIGRILHISAPEYCRPRRRGRRQRLYALGQRPLPIGSNDRVVSRFGSGGARTDIGEIVAHEVSNLHRVIAIGDLRHGEDDRFVLEIDPGAGIKRVIVRCAAAEMIRVFQVLDRIETVGLMIKVLGPQPPRLGHVSPGEGVEICLHTQRVGVLLAPVWFDVLRHSVGGDHSNRHRCENRQRSNASYRHPDPH